MATPNINSSSLSASQIRNEFGESEDNNQVSLGNYRLGEFDVGVLTNLPLDEGIPRSGAISMSDFSNKSLNVIVKMPSGSYHVNAKTEYNNNNITIVKPEKSSKGKKQGGSKIIILCNKKLGAVSPSGSGNIEDRVTQNQCALRTGTWSNPTHVHVILGEEANVRGSGGKGGDGKNNNSGSAQSGADGTSGLGIQHEGTLITLRSGAQLVRGSGGGGGGGHATETSKRTRHAAGGGGGGGAGFPHGAGGEPGTHGSNGEHGEASNETTGGEGGEGGNNEGEAIGGHGGVGGSVNGGNGDGASGESGNGRGEGESEGGSGGEGGAAIRKSSSSITFTIVSNSGTITGATNRIGVQ